MDLMNPKMVLAYDLGGTKIEVGVVDYKGRIKESIRTSVAMQLGKKGVLSQEFINECKEIRKDWSEEDKANFSQSLCYNS